MHGIFIFNYLNDDTTQDLLGTAYGRVGDDMTLFDTIFNTYIVPSLPNTTPTQLRPIWTEHMNFLTRRMGSFYLSYAENRLASLEAPWNNILNGRPSRAAANIARSAIKDIHNLKEQLKQVIVNREKLV